MSQDGLDRLSGLQLALLKCRLSCSWHSVSLPGDELPESLLISSAPGQPTVWRTLQDERKSEPFGVQGRALCLPAPSRWATHHGCKTEPPGGRCIFGRWRGLISWGPMAGLSDREKVHRVGKPLSRGFVYFGVSHREGFLEEAAAESR